MRSREPSPPAISVSVNSLIVGAVVSVCVWGGWMFFYG